MCSNSTETAKQSTLCVYIRFIGWLKNFITDRNNATDNLIDSYLAVTFTRQAPNDLRSCLLARWDAAGRASPVRSFLLGVSAVLRRSRGISGLSEVVVKMTPFTSRVCNESSPQLRAWFDAVSRSLQIRIMTRACIRKNGHRIVKDAYLSYKRNGLTYVGIVNQVFIGVRQSDPHEHACSVCEVRAIAAARVAIVKTRYSGKRLLKVAKSLRAEPYVLVDTRDLLWLYYRAVWDWDDDRQGFFALVRFEQL